MDVQTRKIHFVQEFLRLSDEKLINRFEEMLKLEKLRTYEKKMAPMSTEELNRIIDAAEEDIKNGRMISNADLKREIDSWI